jgi:hypothetical protein
LAGAGFVGSLLAVLSAWPVRACSPLLRLISSRPGSRLNRNIMKPPMVSPQASQIQAGTGFFAGAL